MARSRETIIPFLTGVLMLGLFALPFQGAGAATSFEVGVGGIGHLNKAVEARLELPALTGLVVASKWPVVQNADLKDSPIHDECADIVYYHVRIRQSFLDVSYDLRCSNYLLLEKIVIAPNDLGWEKIVPDRAEPDTHPINDGGELPVVPNVVFQDLIALGTIPEGYATGCRVITDYPVATNSNLSRS